MSTASALRGAALVAGTLAGPFAAASDAVVTQVNGPATLISNTRAYVPVPGVRLNSCDLVNTGPGAAVQIELARGARIAIGPDSRFFADLPLGAVDGAPQYLLSGWAKVAVPKREKTPAMRLNTPHVDLVVDAGVAVVNADAGGAQVYVEAGHVLAQSAGTALDLAAGSTYKRRAGQPASVNPHIDAGLVKAMPRSYRDALPTLLPKIGARAVVPTAASGAQHIDVAAMLANDTDLARCLGSGMVRSAQEALGRKGFDTGPADGVLGPRTQAGLREFQRTRGLAVTGRLDEETLRALDVAQRH